MSTVVQPYPAADPGPEDRIHNPRASSVTQDPSRSVLKQNPPAYSPENPRQPRMGAAVAFPAFFVTRKSDSGQIR